MGFFYRRKWGITLLAIWLILTGLLPFLHLEVQYAGTISAVLAIAAGVLILLDR